MHIGEVGHPGPVARAPLHPLEHRIDDPNRDDGRGVILGFGDDGGAHHTQGHDEIHLGVRRQRVIKRLGFFRIPVNGTALGLPQGVGIPGTGQQIHLLTHQRQKPSHIAPRFIRHQPYSEMPAGGGPPSMRYAPCQKHQHNENFLFHLILSLICINKIAAFTPA